MHRQATLFIEEDDCLIASLPNARYISSMNKQILIVGAFLLMGAGPSYLPDPVTTPGAVNPMVSQENIRATICLPKWTKSIRPSVAITNRLKQQQLANHADQNMGDYEEDHLISLELGGAPDDPRNLWPEAYAGTCGAQVKDQLEDKLHRLVCAGDLQLTDAQMLISSNWVEAYNNYIGPLQCDEPKQEHKPFHVDIIIEDHLAKPPADK